MHTCPNCGTLVSPDAALPTDVALVRAATGSTLMGHVVPLLARGGIWNARRLANHIYAGRMDPPMTPERTISSTIKRTRHTLHPHGLEIVGHRGHTGGYELRRRRVPTSP
jgi:hypothetical protein